MFSILSLLWCACAFEVYKYGKNQGFYKLKYTAQGSLEDQ